MRFQFQFAKGYLYSDTAARQLASDFMDPVFLVESDGLGLALHPTFTTRLGVAIKQTFSKYYDWADDASILDKVETFRFESGMEKVDGRLENFLQVQFSKFVQFSAGFDMVMIGTFLCILNIGGLSKFV